MARLNQSLSQRQTQSLLLKPKMLQSLEMLTMPMMELETFLKHELETNPLMELQENRDEDERDEKPEKEADEKADDIEIDLESEEIDRTIQESQELSEILDGWNEQFDQSYYKAPESEEAMFERGTVSEDEIIRRNFLNQLDKLNLPDNEYDFAWDLIDSANAYGLLPCDFDLHDFAKEYDILPERADEIHYAILHLHPAGITARDQQECLISQLNEENREHKMLATIIRENFDDMIHKRHKKIASLYNVSLHTVLAWREQISHLDPKPGLRVLKNEEKYITPDVIIKKIDDDYEIIINDFYFPKIRMSRSYKNILKNVKSKQEVDYVRGKINSAKFIIKSIYMRNRTLKRVVQSIIKHQYEFFYENSHSLKPLVYSVLADELQVNESTISRVVRTKYADTPFGIMCLKDFFTSKAGKDENYDAVSRHSVEYKIKTFIDNEDKNKPISDQEIAEILLQEGINVSRRVVAKYRQAMGILNSRLRRK
jgi:RNA polymerase sigma-54 factor